MSEKRLRNLVGAVVVAVVVLIGMPATPASAGVTTVTLSGSGAGTVVSEPLGIACSNVPEAEQTACVHDWGFNLSPAKLTATPGPGSSFLGWTGTAGGTCVGATNPCETQILFVDFTANAIFEPTPAAPVVATGPSGVVAFPSATVTGTVNPNSALFPLTACYVEYGLTTDYGERARCRPGSIGAGTSDVAVTASIGPLDPAKTYHYRLVATNAGATVEGGDQTLVSDSAPADSCPNAAIRAQQGALAQRLPDCRAYELVSPTFTSGQRVYVQIGTADGNRVGLSSVGGFAGTESLPLLGATYNASRGDSGWASSPEIPAASELPYSGTRGLVDFTRDRSRTLWFGNLRVDEGTDRFTAVARDVGGAVYVAGPTVEGSAEAPVGASEDLGTIVHQVTERPALSDGTDDERDASRTSLYLASLDSAGHLSLGQVAYRDGATMFPSCAVVLGDANGAARNAISQDGGTVFFTTGAGTGCNAGSTRRVWAKAGAADPVDISASQCAATCGAEAAVNFRGASRDGSRVYFTTTQRLLPEDLDTTASNDLYEYDFEASGQKLRLVTGSPVPAVGANVATGSMFRVSNDGAYVYFVATGRPLTTTPNARGAVPATGQNLYVAHRPPEASSYAIQFIGRLTGTSEQRMQLSSDGRFSVFGSSANLAGDRLAGDTQSDVFWYDATNDQLARVWSNEAEHNGSARVDGILLADKASNASGSSAYIASGGWHINQALADDGSIVGFETSEPLSPDDRNDGRDAYLWESATGRITLLTDGTTKPQNKWEGPGFFGMTPSGDSLFVSTASSIVSAHDSGQYAVYAIRRNGGFLEREEDAAPCGGDGCQGPVAPPPVLQSIGSIAFGGDGNVPLVPGSAKASVVVKRLKPVTGSAARLRVRVPGAGRISVTGSSLRRMNRSVSKAGAYSVRISLSATAKRALRKKKSLKVSARVSFRAKDGQSVSKTVKVTFKRSKSKRAKVKKGGR